MGAAGTHAIRRRAKLAGSAWRHQRDRAEEANAPADVRTPTPAKAQAGGAPGAFVVSMLRPPARPRNAPVEPAGRLFRTASYVP